MYYIINTIKQLASRPSLGTDIVPKTSPQRGITGVWVVVTAWTILQNAAFPQKHDVGSRNSHS